MIYLHDQIIEQIHLSKRLKNTNDDLSEKLRMSKTEKERMWMELTDKVRKEKSIANVSELYVLLQNTNVIALYFRKRSWN